MTVSGTGELSWSLGYREGRIREILDIGTQDLLEGPETIEDGSDENNARTIALIVAIWNYDLQKS